MLFFMAKYKMCKCFTHIGEMPTFTYKLGEKPFCTERIVLIIQLVHDL